MGKVTLEVLSSQIDSLQNDFHEIKEDIKKNTEFRLQAKGFMAAVVMVATTLATGVTWLVNVLMKKGG